MTGADIVTAGADVAAGSKFSSKWDTACVGWLHPSVAWDLTWAVMFYMRSDMSRDVLL